MSWFFYLKEAEISRSLKQIYSKIHVFFHYNPDNEHFYLA